MEKVIAQHGGSATIEIFARLQHTYVSNNTSLCSATIEIFARLQLTTIQTIIKICSATIEIFARLQPHR